MDMLSTGLPEGILRIKDRVPTQCRLLLLNSQGGSGLGCFHKPSRLPLASFSASMYPEA